MNDQNFEPESDEHDDAIIGVALRWSLGAAVLLVAIGIGVAFWLNRPKPALPAKETELAKVELRDPPVVKIPHVGFTDITKAAGITFVHENGAYGQKLLPETMGSGCAFLDFDGDGDQDLLLVNAQRWPEDPRQKEVESEPTLALYRNDGSGRFDDVTTGSGLDVPFYGCGVAVGDYDNDGNVDLFVSAVGKNRLFHNEGQGKFQDVTEKAKIGGDENEWSTSCGWIDCDNDGDLDLFVCNYVKWSRAYDVAQNFQLTGGRRAYGRPQNFEGTFTLTLTATVTRMS